MYTVVAYSLAEDDGFAIGEELASASLTIVEDALLVDIQAEVVPTGYEFGLLATILALIAAIGAWLSVILTRKKTPTPTPKTKPKSK